MRQRALGIRASGFVVHRQGFCRLPASIYRSVYSNSWKTTQLSSVVHTQHCTRHVHNACCCGIRASKKTSLEHRRNAYYTFTLQFAQLERYQTNVSKHISTHSGVANWLRSGLGSVRPTTVSHSQSTFNSASTRRRKRASNRPGQYHVQTPCFQRQYLPNTPATCCVSSQQH